MKNIFLFFILCGSLGYCMAQDPLSIPLRERQSVYNKGNLISNAGFEASGLSHWTVVGSNVALTDEAGSGTHAIKISRTKKLVNEIHENPEGVLSDWIEVIPGNYNFDFSIRLENIYPAVERMQSRIGKGIDVHLEFYDGNKKRIDPGYYFEYLGKEVDNGFKGFAFSNFFYIDKFPWNRVKGRTWNYPYSEGDLPVGCRFVRIFAGLSCSGTMWIDDLDFHLSKWSFTPMDRVDSFFTRKYTPSQLLIPTPHKVENEHPINLRKMKVGLVFNGNSSPETNAALTLLRSRFKVGSGSGGLQIVLLSGEDNAWAEAYHAIANKSQGYFIRRKDNRIFIGANTAKGLYYGATTLCQLVDDGGALLDYVDVTDFPDFTGRSSVLMGYSNDWELDQNKSLTDSAKKASVAERQKNLEQQVRDIDFYAFYKINLLYDNYFQDSRRWWMPGDFYKTYYKDIGDGCAKYGEIIRTAVMVNPYYHIPMEQSVDTLSDSLVRVFAHGTADGFDKILNVIRPALDAGAKTVMVCADDYVPHWGKPRSEYTLFNPIDKAQFTNLANAENYLLNKLQAWLDSAYGKIRLEFVPPQYNNFFSDYTRGTAESYFHDLTNHLDPRIVIVWTGNTIRTLSYDAADIYRYTDMIGRKPMVWDNSPYARIVERPNGGYPFNYPSKSLLCNLFEPFDIQYPDHFSSYLDSSYYSNLGGFGATAKIKYLTFADFSWNNKDYNPDFSLYKALVRYVGRDNGRLLLNFNEAYYQFVSHWGNLRMEKAHDPGYQCTTEEMQQANKVIAQLNAAFETIKKMPQKDLVVQLEGVIKTKVNDWNNLAGKK
jgi:hypothetical protein